MWGISAPEQAWRLQKLWAGLEGPKLEALGYRWVDLSVREILPEAFDLHGQPGMGAFVRTLPRIVDAASLRFAYEQVWSLKMPDEPINLLAAYFDAAASLKKLDMRFDVFDCCFMAVMVSRMVHGDDRAVNVMESDVAIALK